ncbi:MULTISPECIES: ATP-binding protein [Flavobacterium]|uniref:histidine kinase n=2 Tax=Flavobacterium TaxID=237 RepID=A0A2N9P8P2_9FLAO|nr:MULTISPECIES: ATP-binding protein [Flavobacterium]QYS88808.1 response regulator [Flavobacterium davisii]RVU89998.1 response regulator [Flavobacterium columnare]SPE76714.1 Sensory/regulatory protein RpfC [Flavobacterium columnare]
MNKIFRYIFLFINSQILGFYSGADNTSVDSSYYYSEKAIRFKEFKIYDRALENANKSIVFAKKRANSASLANGYYTLGIIYLDFEKYDDAIEKFIRAISVYNTLEPSTKLASSYFKIGICHLHKANNIKAEAYFSKANSVYDNIDLPEAKVVLLLEKAKIYIKQNNLRLAEANLIKLLNSPHSKEIRRNKSEIFFQLGLIKSQERRYVDALEYLKTSYLLSRKEKNACLELRSTEELSKIYELNALTNNSLLFLKKHLRIKDSLERVGELKNQHLINEQVKVDDLMKSIEKMDKDKRSQEKATQFSKLINILAIALITILSLLSLSLYKNNIIRNKSNELLREKNNELKIAKERIEKASKARTEFLSTVSHELRTPLNAINGISHLLLEENPKKSQIEYLKSLKFSGNYLLTYINEILEINRIESNNIEIELINFNFRELINNIHKSLKELADQNNNLFKLEIDEKIPQNLIGDTTKISQIFINLINNALKFTKNGEVVFIANLLSESENLCDIHFEIKDTGIGIPENKQEEIFESFSQGSVEINRKYGGTGLGLTIVKRLVALMKGDIKVMSTVDKGSRFYFDLTLEKGTKEIETSDQTLNNKVFIGKKVLLVEDNKINQMITKKILEKKKMLVTLCETGEDSIEMMRKNQYDITLMDVHLPGINGTIATEKIRKFDEETPIIALTAISLNENREMLLSYGMTDVITKPFNPDDFYKIIETNLL